MSRGRPAAAHKFAWQQKRDMEKLSAGTLSENFPRVAGIIIRMTYYQEMVKGAIIVGAVVLDQWRQKRGGRGK